MGELTMNDEKIPEKFLPLGTVCILKNAYKRVMITGFLIMGQDGDNKRYDYMGCMYPEGILETDQILVFNHSQIKSVVFSGFDDPERKLLNKRLVDLEKSLDGKAA
jgi:hypothetical protein